MTKTSIVTTDERGISLIEILIVVGMLALITAASIPSIVSAFRTSADSFARETSLLLGQARDRAMLTDKLIRLRVDIDHQQMLLEEAPSTYMVRKPPEKPPSEREKEELEKKETETFVPVQDLMKEPRKMPYNLKIIEVRSPRFKRPITEGTADIFFFNNGNADGATIYFETDEKVHHSISIHPITGLTKLEAKAPPEGR